MRHALLPTAALLVTVGYGAAEGLWTGRWADGDDGRVAARVNDIPRTLADWEGTDRELDAREVRVGRIAGHLWRTYQNRRTGEAVTVMILCGRPGPIAVHTPDVCFQGQGCAMAGQPRRQAVPPSGAEFWAARFDQPTAAGADRTAALWAWSADGRWEAAESPRVRYARSPFLFKLYVLRPLGPSASDGADDAALAEFLRLFLPAAGTALFPDTPPQ
ncbi:exosortase-associated EpsI family protein [bacterium]|nr:exosortase-associated EpsI family protein [bacterium]